MLFSLDLCTDEMFLVTDQHAHLNSRVNLICDKRLRDGTFNSRAIKISFLFVCVCVLFCV